MFFLLKEGVHRLMLLAFTITKSTGGPLRDSINLSVELLISSNPYTTFPFGSRVWELFHCWNIVKLIDLYLACEGHLIPALFPPWAPVKCLALLCGRRAPAGNVFLFSAVPFSSAPTLAWAAISSTTSKGGSNHWFEKNLRANETSARPLFPDA